MSREHCKRLYIYETQKEVHVPWWEGAASENKHLLASETQAFNMCLNLM